MILDLTKTEMPSWEGDDTFNAVPQQGWRDLDLFNEIESNAGSIDETGNAPVAEIGLLAEYGVLSDAALWAQAITAYGKAAPELDNVRQVLCRLGAANLSIARLFEGHFNALYLICHYGSPDQIAAAARDAKSGLLFAVWNADLGNGVQLNRICERKFALQGSKRFASGTGLVRRPLITAMFGEDRLMVLVPLCDEDAKFSTWTASGMRASISGDASFDGIEIGSKAIIGQPGDYYRQPHFSGGAWRFLAAQCGAIEALVSHLQAHLIVTGRATDVPQLARLGKALVAAETARLWVHQASQKAEDQGADGESRVAYVNLARQAVERAALDVVEIAHQSAGLSSFLKPHPIERICRDLSVYLRQPAPDQALLSAARYAIETKKAGK